MVVIAVVAFVLPTASATPTRAQNTALLRAGDLQRQVGRVTSGVVLTEPGHDAPGLIGYGPGFPMSGRSEWFATRELLRAPRRQPSPWAPSH